MKTTRIFLIGYMGCGKTTVGKRLAAHLSMEFVDLDHFIENRYHKTIRDIFAEKGEAAFRELERKALQEVSLFENVVISTGGGVACFFDNLEFMKNAGKTIYLKVSVNELAARLNVAKHNRPLIKDKNLEEIKEFIQLNLEKRESFYGQAHYVFDTEKLENQKDIDGVTHQIADFISINNTEFT